MKHDHEQIMRALIAAQVALLEHCDEQIGTNGAKDALIKHLNAALKLAKKLDD
jgi:hypothetical protein